MHSETTNYRNRNRGISIIYGVIYMTLFAAFCTLAADYGRVQIADAELQKMVDASARAGASGILKGTATVNERAKLYAEKNVVDGGQYTTLKVESGKWNEKTRSFTLLTGFDQGGANAVRVTASRKVQLQWAPVFSKTIKDCTVDASAIAFLRGGDFNFSVHPRLNPYLAGMPNGAVTLNIPAGEDPDYGDTNFVAPVQGVPVYEGAQITFDEVTGQTQNDPGNAFRPGQGPDGELDRMFTKYGGIPEFGIASVKAPANCMIGVFLTDDAPNLSEAPEALDFSTSNSRNRSEYKPKLKQPFFIGDGKTDNGTTQKFVAPKGATRLFIASMDEYEWSNNKGKFLAKGRVEDYIYLVK